MYACIKDFVVGDSGAITVDWVVLTGATVGLGLATMAVVSGGVENLSVETSDHLTDVEITAAFGAAAAAMMTVGDIVSWHHDEQWYNNTTGNYSDPGVFSEAQLIAQHQAMANIILAANPQDIQSGHYHNAIDHMGAIEIGMEAQGVDVPDSGITYSEAHAAYQAAQAS